MFVPQEYHPVLETLSFNYYLNCVVDFYSKDVLKKLGYNNISPDHPVFGYTKTENIIDTDILYLFYYNPKEKKMIYINPNTIRKTYNITEAKEKYPEMFI